NSTHRMTSGHGLYRIRDRNHDRTAPSRGGLEARAGDGLRHACIAGAGKTDRKALDAANTAVGGDSSSDAHAAFGRRVLRQSVAITLPEVSTEILHDDIGVGHGARVERLALRLPLFPLGGRGRRERATPRLSPAPAHDVERRVPGGPAARAVGAFDER